MSPIMSERGGPDTHAVPPTVLVSAPAEETAKIVAKSTLAGRRRSKTESSALAEPGRRSANEWIDIDHHEPARRRRASKRRATASNTSQKSRNVDLDLGRFLPRLGRILESTDGSADYRPHKRVGEARRKLEKGTSKSHRNKQDQGETHRRSVKYRVGNLSKQNQTTLKINPSLLSVISGLTGISDSSSNTTITQQSYNSRSNNDSSSGIQSLHRRSESAPIASGPHIINVFDYMESASTDTEDDDRSECSSPSSSHYSPSDAGSSEAPQTPSSNSTYPSPTATISGSSTGSVTGTRHEYGVRFAAAIDSPMNSRHGSESDAESLNKRQRGSNAAHSGSDCSATSVHSHGSHSRRRSRASQSEEQQHIQLDARQHHILQPPAYHGSHLVEPDYGQIRSPSTSSADSDGSRAAYAQYMAMQQYQQPSAPAHVSPLAPQQDATVHIMHPDRPPVPDAPDLSQRTLAGYEMLAQELASAESPVKPVYRKFEYLNHRILLHLQDELCEMEEQLRITDEIIAQMETPSDDGSRIPASRRGEAFGGSEMHHRRTALLGRIFLKTEQYNRAISSFALLTKDSRPAGSENVATYRKWMVTKVPIHDTEAKFLQNAQDLIEPGKFMSSQSGTDMPSQSHPSEHAAALSCLPVALMLPLLLYSIIPTLAGRLVVTLLIGIGVFLVAATTRIRHMMEMHEWAVCGGAYVLIMAAIAGCIPQHAA